MALMSDNDNSDTQDNEKFQKMSRGPPASEQEMMRRGGRNRG